MKKNFELGDTVRLMRGVMSPIMTVERLEPDKLYSVFCVWYDDVKREYVRDQFVPETLECANNE